MVNTNMALATAVALAGATAAWAMSRLAFGVDAVREGFESKGDDQSLPSVESLKKAREDGSVWSLPSADEVRKMREMQGGGSKAARLVFDTYLEVLGREPTEKEIREALADKVSAKKLAFRLRSSDEYTNKFRLGASASSPDPNASLVVRDTEVIERMMLIYRFVKEKDARREIRYPLRDLWIILEANDRKVVGMLRTKWWDGFEDDIVREVPNGLNRAKLVEMLRKIEKKYGPGYIPEFQGDMSGLEALLDGDMNVVDDDGKLATCRLSRSDPNSVAGMSRSELEQMFEEISRRIIATNDANTRKMLAKAKGKDPDEPSFPKFWHQQVTIDPERDLVIRPEFQWAVPQIHQPACHNIEDGTGGRGPTAA